MSTQPQPPYQPPAGWAGMAQHAQQPVQQPVQPIAEHSSTPGLVAAGAGTALIVGSFMPWATVSAPILGSISMSGTDGSDGWVTVFLGVLLVGYGLVTRARRLPMVVDIFAAMAGIGAIGWAGWHIYDLQRLGEKMQAGMAQTAGDDPFGPASSLAAASQFKVGGGLWLLVAAGLVATLSAGFGLYKRV